MTADGRRDIRWRFSNDGRRRADVDILDTKPAGCENPVCGSAPGDAVENRICLIDCRDGLTREAFAAPPQISSNHSPWNGILLERHLLPPFKAPEVMLLEPFLTIVVDGEGEVQLQREGKSERLEMGPGRVCVLGAGPVPPMRIGGRMTSIFISLRPWMFPEYAADSIDPATMRLRNSYSIPDPQFFHIAMALSAEIEQGYPGGRLYGESLAAALVTHLLTGYALDGHAIMRAPARLDSGGCGWSWITSIRISPATFRSLNSGPWLILSPCRFARVFKQAVGLPPHQFVLRKKIARARGMLEASATPLSELSASLGFESQSHFTAVFHKFVGTTPKAYRARQRG